jgi:hypothetical protein
MESPGSELPIYHYSNLLDSIHSLSTNIYPWYTTKVMRKYFGNIQAYENIRILRNGAGMTNFDWLEEIRAI